jgi:Holliday junction resolvase RusA-like endonuclease
MSEHSFTVNRRPKAKGRPRSTKTGHVYTPATTREYETAVKDAYKSSGGPKFLGPVNVNISVYKDHVDVTIKDIDDNGCKLRGDLDNYIKSILDGLNKVAYLDDKQVHELQAEKR